MNIYIVDTFTKTPFSGNPAGVCILDNELDENLMQNIAKEVNLSETSFVLKQGDTFLSGGLRQQQKFLCVDMQHSHLLIFYGNSSLLIKIP